MKKKKEKIEVIYEDWPKCPNCGKDLLFIRKYKHKIKNIWMVEFICAERSCPHINLRIPLDAIKFDLERYREIKRTTSSIAEGFETKIKKMESQIKKMVSDSVIKKLCPVCGNKNPADGKFCTECGAKLK